jgi:hypothetical protein
MSQESSSSTTCLEAMATASALTPIQVVRWGLQHVDIVRDVGDAAQRLAGATSYSERWSIIKPVGDKMAAAADALFENTVAVSAEEFDKLKLELLKACSAGVHAQAFRDGKWLERAIQLIQVLAPLLAPILMK